MASAVPPRPQPANPSPALVGNHFIKQYYGEVLPKKPLELHRFYAENSTFCHATGNTQQEAVSGLDNIKAKIQNLGLADATVDLNCGSVDAQPSQSGGIILMVTGAITLHKQAPRQFAQTFFLAVQKQPNDKHNFYVLNDIFRLLDTIPSVVDAAVNERLAEAAGDEEFEDADDEEGDEDFVYLAEDEQQALAEPETTPQEAAAAVDAAPAAAPVSPLRPRDASPARSPKAAAGSSPPASPKGSAAAAAAAPVAAKPAQGNSGGASPKGTPAAGGSPKKGAAAAPAVVVPSPKAPAAAAVAAKSSPKGSSKGSPKAESSSKPAAATGWGTPSSEPSNAWGAPAAAPAPAAADAGSAKAVPQGAKTVAEIESAGASGSGSAAAAAAGQSRAGGKAAGSPKGKGSWASIVSKNSDVTGAPVPPKKTPKAKPAAAATAATSADGVSPTQGGTPPTATTGASGAPHKDAGLNGAATSEPPCTSLYVKNVDLGATDRDLRQAFEQFGPIQNIALRCDRGFAFIYYHTTEPVAAAIRARAEGLELNVNGRILRYELKTEHPQKLGGTTGRGTGPDYRRGGPGGRGPPMTGRYGGRTNYDSYKPQQQHQQGSSDYNNGGGGGGRFSPAMGRGGRGGRGDAGRGSYTARGRGRGGYDNSATATAASSAATPQSSA